ncbi:hypothetical protein KAR52_02125 [Candidatus Pacearchaeota archaeon]|nr:hypothetical protein [Candidatus Pacearchaeota archaeon]
MVKIKADLHNHLKTLSGMNGLFNKTIDKISFSLDVGGLMGLVNYEDKRYESFIGLKGYNRENLGNAIYIPEKDILIIKGQEIPTKQGDLLVLGLDENQYLQSGRSLEDTFKEAKDNNGIIITDHPFYFAGVGYYLKRNPRLLEYLDGMEIHNGEANIWIPKIAPANANKISQEFYEEIKNNYDMGAISCSDGHSLYEIGSSYIFLEKPNIENSEKLNESLRKSIRGHKDFYQDKQTNSNIGAIDHISKLVGLKVLQKLGIKF